MALNDEQLEREIASIRNHCDLSSHYYGRLVNWTDPVVWHYGIGLSESHIFDTGSGLCTFRFGYRPKLVIGVDDALFSPAQTIERLIHALRVFRHWNYGLLGWNCEHLARLVATDDPISFEVLKAPWPVPSFNHDGRHPTARHELSEHIRAHAPEVLVRRPGSRP